MHLFSENAQRLFTLEEAAKAAGKGKWNPEVVTSQEKYTRDIKWTIESPRQFVDSFHQKPIDGGYKHGCVQYSRTFIVNRVKCLEYFDYFLKIYAEEIIKTSSYS